jgi:FkbM family methyltransferase
LILFRSDGRRPPNRLEKILLKAAGGLRRLLLVRVRLDDNGHRSVYLCESKHDAERPMSLWLKEEGTMRWIDGEVRAGDIFMDIGANIGIYTLAAAHRVGETGKVYAFEPHKMNGVTLLRNLAASGLAGRVDFFACALSDASHVLPFNYVSLASASSGSQFGHTRVAGASHDFKPVAREMLAAVTVDELIAGGTIKAPNLVKIDVDGNEIKILQGMKKLLAGKDRPRAVQVELNIGEQEEIASFLADCGYALAERHHTRPGARRLKSGIPLEKVAHNAIFRPRQAA